MVQNCSKTKSNSTTQSRKGRRIDEALVEHCTPFSQVEFVYRAVRSMDHVLEESFCRARVRNDPFYKG